MEELIQAVRNYPCLWDMKSREYRDIRKKEVIWHHIVTTLKNKDIPDAQAAKAEWKKLRDCHRDSLKRTKSKTGQATAEYNSWRYAELMDFLVPFMRHRKKKGFKHCKVDFLPSTSDLQEVDDEISNSSSHVTDYQDTIQTDFSSSINEQTDRQPDTIDVYVADETGQNYFTNSITEPTKRKSENLDDNVIDMLREIKENYKRRCEQREQRRMVELEKTANKHPLDPFFESMCASTKQFPTWLQNSVKRKVFAVITEAEDIFQNFNSNSNSLNSRTSQNVCRADPTIIPDN